MRRFRPDELRTLLVGVDRELASEVTIVLIGGTAIALRFAPGHATTDIDTIGPVPAALVRALQRAKQATGLEIELSSVGVYTAPRDFEERLEPLVVEGLERLHLTSPERHDLAIMKIARGDEHDLIAVEEIHRAAPLDPAMLLARFREAQPVHIGNPGEFRDLFLTALERLFGQECATAAAEDLG